MVSFNKIEIRVRGVSNEFPWRVGKGDRILLQFHAKLRYLEYSFESISQW